MIMTMNVDTNYAPFNIGMELTIKKFSYLHNNTKYLCYLQDLPYKTLKQKTVSVRWVSQISDYKDCPSSGMCMDSPTLMKMAAVSSETSAHFYQITWCHIPHQNLFCWITILSTLYVSNLEPAITFYYNLITQKFH